MNTAEFLARVVPTQGNYVSILVKGDHITRILAFPIARGGFVEAARSIRFWTDRNADVYHAIGAFTTSEIKQGKNNKDYVTASKEQANVQCIKTLIIDADVKRDGDKKTAHNAFADRREAIAWLTKFCADTTLPMPNLAVDSGHGFHWYWVLQNAMTPASWQLLANALRAAMLAHGWRCDTGSTIDCSRLLRPPGACNFKSGIRVPVTLLTARSYQNGNYANGIIAQALTPWLNMTQAVSAATGTHGHTATIHTLGARPVHVAGTGAALNQAASQGIERRDYKFTQIATKCAQAGMSLASHGVGDSRDVWYLANMLLAGHCSDGRESAHAFSSGHPAYTSAGIDKLFDDVQHEIDTKKLGAPVCKTYDGHRPGVCTKCPLWGRINSPISLGVEDGDLPDKYRRSVSPDRIEYWAGKGKDASWQQLMPGKVHSPRLDQLATGGHQLTFTYEVTGTPSTVCVKGADVGNPMTILPLVERQGITTDRHLAGAIGDFVSAWISKLRSQRAQQTGTVLPFGYNFDAEGEVAGLAIAGDHYKRDGSTETVSGGDAKINVMYRPAGTMANWRRAAALFEGARRPDLQAMIAASFAAPLIALCGDVKGMSMNFWSTESGVGKSSAIFLGQSVWGDYKSMQSMRDTPNAVMRSLSIPRVLIRYWDEMRVLQKYQSDFTELIYTIPTGKERARMMADTTLREVGEWETMLVFTANRSCADYLIMSDQGTDAGMQRLFEVWLPKVGTPYDGAAAQTLNLIDKNYGHAGRVYAAWLAQHVPEVKDALAKMKAALTQALAVQQDERFLVTCMTCLLIGASIAKKLELFDFDVKGVHDCLAGAFLSMRDARLKQTLVAPAGTGYDLEELLSQYLYEQADFKLHTTRFAGPGKARVDVLARPIHDVVRLQIAETPGTLRLQRALFLTWLHDRSLPARTIMGQMETTWGASQGRQSFGAGTKWAGGQIWCLDVPLQGPLAIHLHASNVPAPGSAPPPRKGVIPGNQARV